MPPKTGLYDTLRKQLGGEYHLFKECVSHPRRTSFRANPLKCDPGELIHLAGEPVPWCPGAFFTDEKVGDSAEHFQGLLYVQEAASMLAVEALSPRPGERVLDMCAAPGSKATQAAAKMENRGLLVACDSNPKRLKSLEFNAKRMGAVNCAICLGDSSKLDKSGFFDRVLLDAPCTNTGQLRSNPDAEKTWTKAKLVRCVGVQKKLIAAAAKTLNSDGVLVYSTCSHSVEENEEVVDYAVKELALTVEPIKADIKAHHGFTSWGQKTYDESIADTLRIYPHDNDTEGFYAAKLRK